MKWLFATALAASFVAGAERYSLRSEARELEVNTRGEVAFIVEAVGEHTFDGEYAVELVLTLEGQDKAVALSKSRFGKKDANYTKDGKTLTWKTWATAHKAGRFPLRANMKFRVCEEDDDCFDHTAELKITLIAKE
ncbi:MAG TPA: hypothetical protein VFB62_10760 [Polyangiaceae bacterium]|jgi:hypothetical protein|nr:hypothetical protein [Polyangiaceae bacterium]